MENSAETHYAWEPALRQVYAELGIEPAASRCAEAAANDAPGIKSRMVTTYRTAQSANMRGNCTSAMYFWTLGEKAPLV